LPQAPRSGRTKLCEEAIQIICSHLVKTGGMTSGRATHNQHEN
jgi:hypothetical protein